MDDTIRRMAKVLGGRGLETARNDTRFEVEDTKGTRLKLNIESGRQRIMGVLTDATGQTRCTFDLAPIGQVREDPAAPGRVSLQVGTLEVRLDSQPSLAVELITR